MSFWKELSRRNVVKVGIAYAVAAWLIIHPVDIIFPILHMPEWTITLVTAILIILFPLILIFAWAYEITPKGLKKTKEVPVSKSITHLTGKRLNYIIVGLLVIAVAYLLFDKYYINRHATETLQVPAVTEIAKTQKTIAVLPFVNMSPDKDQEYFVDGLSEEILNTLAKIPNLGVTARTSSFFFKGTNKKVQEIAKELGVDNILEGSVRKSGSDLRITAQLVRATDGLHLWSENYDRKLKDIFAVQEDIATAVADELKITLGIGKSLKQLGGTDNEKAYELYLIAKGKGREGPTTVNQAHEPIDEALKLDPKFALAWALKARIYGNLIVPADQLASIKDEVPRAINKAIEIEPNLPEGYSALGSYKSGPGGWIDAEVAFIKARELVPETSLQYEYEFPPHYSAVGHLKRAKEIIEAQMHNDPLNGNFRSIYILYVGMLGDRKQIEEEYEGGKVLYGDQWSMTIGVKQAISTARLGVGKYLSRDDIVYSDLILDVIKDNIESPQKGLTELHRYANDNSLSGDSLNWLILGAAYFSDSNFAMESVEKALRSNTLDVSYLWYPVMHDVRQLPRFKKLIKEIGLVDYWNKFGWPDMCHKLDNGDFACD
jgi:adenylate cyclase